MTSPIIDAGNGVGTSYGGSSSSTNSGSTNSIWGTNTTGAGVLFAVFNYCETSGTPTLTSVSANGNAMTLCSRTINTTSGGHRSTIEVWQMAFTSGYNHAGANVGISWTASANYDDLAFIAFAVTGVFSTASPFDSGSVPDGAFNTTSTTPPGVTFSTSQADDLILYFSGRSNGTTGSVAPTGYTSIGTHNNGGGINNAYINGYYKSVSATQSGVTVTDGSGTSDVSWTTNVDAVTADNNNTNVSATVSLALGKAAFSVSETTHEEGGTATLALGKLAFSAAGSERVTGAVSFALGKAKFSILAGTFLGTAQVLGAASLRVVRGIRDTIAGNSVVGRVPGAAGGAQVVPITMIADQVGRILAGSQTTAPTTKSAGAAALQKQSQAIANTAVAARILGPCMVSQLPAGSDGLRGFVTDSTQTTTAGIGTAVVGGGSNHVPVYYDGGANAWTIG